MNENLRHQCVQVVAGRVINKEAVFIVFVERGQLDHIHVIVLTSKQVANFMRQCK